MARFTRRLVHDVDAGSNLDLLLRGFNGLGNRFVDALNNVAGAIREGNADPKIAKALAVRVRTITDVLKKATINQSKEK